MKYERNRGKNQNSWHEDSDYSEFFAIFAAEKRDKL